MLTPATPSGAALTPTKEMSSFSNFDDILVLNIQNLILGYEMKIVGRSGEK